VIKEIWDWFWTDVMPIVSEQYKANMKGKVIMKTTRENDEASGACVWNIVTTSDEAFAFQVLQVYAPKLYLAEEEDENADGNQTETKTKKGRKKGHKNLDATKDTVFSEWYIKVASSRAAETDDTDGFWRSNLDRVLGQVIVHGEDTGGTEVQQQPPSRIKKAAMPFDEGF
jgi:hypothetical protein